MTESDTTNFHMEINIIYLRLLSSSLLTAHGLNFKFLLLSLVWSEIDLMNLIPAYCKYTVPHIFQVVADPNSSTGRGS